MLVPIPFAKIEKLKQAAELFLLHYTETLPELHDIKIVKEIKKSYITNLDPKFLLKDYDIQESGIGIAVKKQETIHYPPPRVILHPEEEPNRSIIEEQIKKEHRDNNPTCAFILEEKYTDPLGLPASLYHYIILRKKLTSYWSRSLGLERFRDKVGTWVPHCIIKHIADNRVEDNSRLVILVQDSSKIFMAKGRVLTKFFVKYGDPVFINKNGEYITGFPIDLFEELKIPS